MRIDDRGSATIWMLGLSVLLLAFGGLALDFWRGLALQRQLAAVADSAAIAAASGIDEEHYRSTGEVLLSPTRSRSLALASIDFQDIEVDDAVIVVAPDGSEVAVQVGGRLELGLLGVLVDETEPLIVRASAAAVPQVLP